MISVLMALPFALVSGIIIGLLHRNRPERVMLGLGAALYTFVLLVSMMDTTPRGEGELRLCDMMFAMAAS